MPSTDHPRTAEWMTMIRRPPRRLVDGFFFVLAGLATLWLALLAAQDTFHLGWRGLPLLVVFWATLAYLALPRLHRILTAIYVPDYFIGRTRTSDGLLGDPVNLALRGDEVSLHRAMQAAGWTRADEVTLRSSLRIVTSTLARRSYDEAPVSPLLLFGRQQDFAYQQEVLGNPARRHHVRFWRCPPGWPLPGGTRVDWLAAGTFDRAVGLSLFTLQVTHRIDENTDVERDHIVRTLLDAGAGARMRVLRDFSTGYHARNGGGDSIRTDGDLPIIDLRPAAPATPAVAAPAAPAIASAPAGGVDAAATPPTHPTPPEGSSAADPTGPDEADADAWIARTAEERAAGEVRKRTAYEPLALEDALDASSVEAVRRHGRPATIVFGAVVVFLRALATAAIAWGLARTDRSTLIRAIETSGLGVTDPAALAQSRAVLVAATIAIAAVSALLGVLLLRGSDLARLVLLGYAAATTVAAFLAWWAGEPLISDLGEFGVVALNVLILLALSGRPARAFTLANRMPQATPRPAAAD
jgi:hypothetical protein